MTNAGERELSLAGEKGRATIGGSYMEVRYGNDSVS
jgi:hypothetical protein